MPEHLSSRRELVEATTILQTVVLLRRHFTSRQKKLCEEVVHEDAVGIEFFRCGLKKWQSFLESLFQFFVSVSYVSVAPLGPMRQGRWGSILVIHVVFSSKEV